MGTEEFVTGLELVAAIAGGRRTALMCAEADWRRCHRRLLADLFTVKGWRVAHLRDGPEEEHQLTPFAVVEEGRLTYPPNQGRLEV